jgi:hypothetical protein
MNGALSSTFTSFPFLLFFSSSLSLFYSLPPFSSSLLFPVCSFLSPPSLSSFLIIFLPSFLFPSFPFLFPIFPLLPSLLPYLLLSSPSLPLPSLLVIFDGTKRGAQFLSLSLSLSSYTIFFSLHDSSRHTPSSLLAIFPSPFHFFSSPHNSLPSSPLYTSPIVIATTIATKIVTTHSRTKQNKFISP